MTVEGPPMDDPLLDPDMALDPMGYPPEQLTIRDRYALAFIAGGVTNVDEAFQNADLALAKRLEKGTPP